MNVLLDDEEQLIKTSAGEFLAAESTPAVVRAAEKDPLRYSKPLWNKFADLGWLGISLPEAQGGQGLPWSYTGLVFEELGRYIAPLPVHATLVPALVIAKHGSEQQRQALLPRVIDGSLMLSWALQEKDGRWSKDAVAMKGRLEGGHVVLTGAKHFVDNFGNADQCLVVFRMQGGKGGLRAILVDTKSAGIQAEELVPTTKDREDFVRFESVRVPEANLVGQGDAVIDDLMDYAAVLFASLMEGAARRAMEMSIAYVNEREAFGQPIGSFQAIQHMAADMLNGVDGTQLLTREALWRISEALPARVEVAQAKSFGNVKCLYVVRCCQQLHGGIGFIVDTDINLWYRRVTSWSMRAGTTYEHRQLIAAALLDTPGKVRLGMTQQLPSTS
ncbi:acyl-CoA dehydrogenase family protein [Caenimonas aquaedulcis]|uniref:Acyl-CoA/acyl-ACP dehydrogenase n=1 Tax=Caenimonas aquaedulcis TaxID=2793270 RepID=A0A931H965_9BURK|nr:acyl-CoA dehydrogenase family protein [Caenimonas aquaedulcis]MBG9390687.1 acyl-CoA/acyl-ACP dehydrogenase [Caenimonas aquaedulcis]